MPPSPHQKERNPKGLVYQLMALFKNPNSYASLSKVPVMVCRQQDSRKYILDRPKEVSQAVKQAN